MKIALGGDHAGYYYKKALIKMLEKEGHEVKDFGAFSEESVDYPDFVHPLATAIELGEFNLGILICGSGNGVAMARRDDPDPPGHPACRRTDEGG